MKGLIPATVAFYMRPTPMGARFGAFLDLAKIESVIRLEGVEDGQDNWRADILVTDMSAQGVIKTHLHRPKVKAIIMISEVLQDEASSEVPDPSGSSRKIAIHIRNQPENAEAFGHMIRTVLNRDIPAAF